MVFPQVATESGGSVVVNATSHTVTLPASVAAGDLLVVLFATDGVVFTSVATIGWPAGWTEFFNNDTDGAFSLRLAAAWRIADGSEGASIDVTTSASEMTAYRAFRITAHDPATAPEAAGTSGNSTAPNPSSLDPAGWVTEDTLWIAVTGWDNPASMTLNTYPASYTNGVNSAGNNAGGVGVARRELNAASEDPGAFAFSASRAWVACTVAVRPAEDVDAAPRLLTTTGAGK